MELTANRAMTDRRGSVARASFWTAAKRVTPAFLASRVLVFLVGMNAQFSFGDAHEHAVNFWGLFSVSTYEWDAGWYTTIAQHGYGAAPQAHAFFPLYPLLIAAVGPVFGLVNGGTVISLVAFFIGLTLLYQLVELDFRARIASGTVVLVAFSPLSFFFSAVFTEGLFFCLSVGCLYAARRDRWLAAGVLGALAGFTRSSGTLLVVPLVLMYLYGPYGQERASRPDWAALWQRRWQVLRPRRRPGRRMLWILLVPVGMIAFTLYLQFQYNAGFSWETDQSIYWGHNTEVPIVGFIDGLRGAWHTFNPVYLHVGSSAVSEWYEAVTANLNFAAAVLGLIGVIGCLVTLPAWYSSYALVSYLMPLSAPVRGGTPLYWQALNSIGRYESVIFPFFIWLALYLCRKRWVAIGVGSSAILLGLATSLFASGYWVG